VEKKLYQRKSIGGQSGIGITQKGGVGTPEGKWGQTASKKNLKKQKKGRLEAPIRKIEKPKTQNGTRNDGSGKYSGRLSLQPKKGGKQRPESKAEGAIKTGIRTKKLRGRRKRKASEREEKRDGAAHIE